jgi:hypothetical protein
MNFVCEGIGYERSFTFKRRISKEILHFWSYYIYFVCYNKIKYEEDSGGICLFIYLL